MATSKRDGEPCCMCGDRCSSYWRGRGRTVALCGDCINEMIEDYGSEFPEEIHDDLPPDDPELIYSDED